MSKPEKSMKKPGSPGSTLFFKQAEEFETKLQKENMNLYRKLRLGNYVAPATCQPPKT